MVISDSELPPRINKHDNARSSEESETETETDSEEDNSRDRSFSGKVRTVSMIASGAMATGGTLAVPVVVPARNRKSTLYESEKVFEEFDNQAIQVIVSE